jgi:hypothetical protein
MIYSQNLKQAITIAETIYFLLTKRILITKKELKNLTTETETIVATMPGIDGLTEVVLELLKDKNLLQNLPISNFIDSDSSIYQGKNYFIDSDFNFHQVEHYFFDKQTNQVICDGADTWKKINDDAKFLLIRSFIVDKNLLGGQ